MRYNRECDTGRGFLVNHTKMSLFEAYAFIQKYCNSLFDTSSSSGLVWAGEVALIPPL